MTMLRRGGAIALFVGLMVAGWQFADGNAAPVDVDYLFGVLQARPLWQALTVAAAIGAVGILLPFGIALLGARLECRRYRKSMLALESEVHQLRNLPVVSKEERSAQSTPTVASVDRGR